MGEGGGEGERGGRGKRWKRKFLTRSIGWKLRAQKALCNIKLTNLDLILKEDREIWEERRMWEKREEGGRGKVEAGGGEYLAEDRWKERDSLVNGLYEKILEEAGKSKENFIKCYHFIL